MFRQITGTIGNMMQNIPEDVLQVKSALEKLGRFDFTGKPEPHGYVTKELDGSIREYQRDRGLRIDGWMRPGGETERSLTREIQDKTTARNIFLPAPAPSSHPPRYEFPNGTLPRFNKDKVAVALKNYVTAKNQPQPPAQTKQPEPYGPPAPDKNNKKNSDLANWTTKALDIYRLEDSKKLFEKYLENSGKPVEMSSKDINRSVVIKDAIEKNKRRFEDSMTKGKVDNKAHDFKNKILSLKNGESIVLNNKESPGGGDYWDRDIKSHDSLKKGDIDFFAAFGDVKLRSTGSFQATRKDNKVYIEGVVDNSLKDKYNFNEEDVLLRPWANEENQGRAKSYGIRGSKLQKVKGTLEINNGAIHNSKFEWQDLD